MVCSLVMRSMIRSTLWLWVIMLLVLVKGWCCFGCLEQERIALLQLKANFINYPNGDALPSWAEEEITNCCQWEGVVCNTTTNRITQLSLNFTRPYWILGDGYFNASLFLPFEELTTLHLPANGLAGCVENEGFERLSKLSNLEILNLEGNHLDNSVFSSFSGLSSLKYLYLGWNRLGGSADFNSFERLSKLSNLEVLDLSYNRFNNSVLSSLSSLSSLKSLYLRGNGLGESANFNTAGFGRLTSLSNLEVLDLGYNGLNNSIHSFLKLDDLVSLKELDLRNNQIESFEPVQGLEGSLVLSNLEVLKLFDNSLNNSILPSLRGLSTLKFLDLSWNRLEGSIHIKELYALSNLKELDLTHNDIQSFEPIQGLEGSSVLSNLEVLKLSQNNLNNSILPSLRGLSTLKFLDLSSNQLKGSIHVKELYALSNLEELDLSGNVIRSFVNPRGVKGLEQLKVLHLDGAKLNTSNLLKFLTPLTSLKTLYLEGSEIKGAFTTQGFRNLSNLENLFLDWSSLSNNFLQSIGELSSLKVLFASDCGLNGNLPTQGWCELKNLQELDLSRNQLEGVLPSCLGNLTSLRVFDLSDNQLTGSIALSPLSTLTSLEYLSLSTNHFQVPNSFRSFANHSNLKVLLCDKNIRTAENELNTWAPKFQLKVFVFSYSTKDNVDVSLPSFLYYQYDLRIVDLSHNKLSGTFPDWLLENNTRLERLFLRNNSLVRPLNLLSHAYPNILEVDISNNKIGGRIPPNMSSIFPNLLVLNLSGNAFDGNLIPYDMYSLRFLDLSNNLLSGVMPEYFTNHCPSLEVIILSNNNLSGKIFPTVFNLTQLHHLHLDGNSFIGNVPDSLSLMPLSTLDVSQNLFSGELPRWMGNMTDIFDILMSKNHFQGPIPVEFCQLKDLMFLDLSENNLSGSIPSCFNSPSIAYVHLDRNRLEGPMTHAFYNSSSLKTLDLRENYLSGSIPTWISKLSTLSVLLLKANNFEGKIPSQLCQLKRLTIVDLSQNNLSGSLPPCLGNTIPFEANEMLSRPDLLYGFYGNQQGSLSSYVKTLMSLQMENSIGLDGATEEVEFTTKKRSDIYKGTILSFMSGIDFSCNQLTGEIPLEFGNLSNVRALNLSHNNFTGSIPATFSNLRQVESLDLSHNNLNGRIPSQLIGLNFLEVFSVAHNNLSGMTPDRKAQFATFEESSYEGNPFLCGPPLHNNCSDIWPPSPMPNASDNPAKEDGFIDMGVFYVSFYASYITVLSGIAVVLYINPYWRRAWFYLIELCITSSYYFVVDNFPKMSKFRNK